LAVAEVQSDFALRATATVIGEVASDASLSALVNLNQQGKCAITLDPKNKFPGQQAYQGVVPLIGEAHEKLEKLSEVLQHYMLQSEQLDTTLVLAADDKVAAGLLIQRLPPQGAGNLAGGSPGRANEDEIGVNEDYQRIAVLASSLQREELLTLDADTILRRLFWQEKVLRFEPLTGDAGPRFSCTCSRERVGKMILGLGLEEAQSIVAERGEIEVGCEFCGAQQHFDPIDVAQIFAATGKLPPVSPMRH
ncbi:MAG: Hsp33 family molecular chaperone HslO, partial [Rhodoferax sp.]|nr:Hsp33 family molecular chaperone HslO [Rhodoferax sp.]